MSGKTHITAQQSAGYRRRTLSVEELHEVDAHLSGCEECRDALFVAMGASLAGIFLSIRSEHSLGNIRRLEVGCLAVALIASAVQLVLVWQSRDQMTLYGGVTERIVVAATLAWVVAFCLRPRAPAG